MFLHHRLHSVCVFQEVDVHDLIDLVGVDALEEHLCRDVLDVRLGCRDGGDAAARESDLGRGREGVDAIHRARLARDVEDVLEFVILVVEPVHHIGVVPEDAEIACRRLHGGEALDHAVRERDARGIGVLGHAPDALDGVVLPHEGFDDVHIGAVLLHADGDHLDAELLADGEVTVIARSGTDELHLFEIVPRSAAEDSELLGEMHEGVHEVEAAAVADEHFLLLHAEELRKEGFARLGAAEIAVVARVGGFSRIVVSARLFKHGHCDLELFLGRSAAGHIHVSALFHQLFEAFLLVAEQLFEFLDGKRLIIHDPPVAAERRTAEVPRSFQLSYHKTRAYASGNFSLPHACGHPAAQRTAISTRSFSCRRCRPAPKCEWACPRNRNCGEGRSRDTSCS